MHCSKQKVQIGEKHPVNLSQINWPLPRILINIVFEAKPFVLSAEHV